MNLAERIRWALEKRGGSRRDWSLAAGRSHAQVTMMLRRLDAGETPAFEGKVFEDLARAAGVDAHWLQTGEGEPIAGPDSGVGAFEGALGWFVATEEHEGRGDEARRFLAQREQANAGVAGLSPDAWLAKLRDEYRAWRRPGKALGVTEIGEDEPARVSKVTKRGTR